MELRWQEASPRYPEGATTLLAQLPAQMSAIRQQSQTRQADLVALASEATSSRRWLATICKTARSFPTDRSFWAHNGWASGIRTIPAAFWQASNATGASYHSGKLARDRDRLRQEVLESLGWNILRIWSTDYFRDRDRTMERIHQALRELPE